MFMELEIVVSYSVGMGDQVVTEIVMVVMDVFTDHMKTLQISELAFVARLGAVYTVKGLDQLVQDQSSSGEVAD